MAQQERKSLELGFIRTGYSHTPVFCSKYSLEEIQVINKWKDIAGIIDDLSESFS